MLELNYCVLKKRIMNKLTELNSQDYHDIGTMCACVCLFVSIAAAIRQRVFDDLCCIYSLCSVRKCFR